MKLSRAFPVAGLAVVLAAAPLLGAQPAQPRTKEAAIRELLDLTGSGKLGLQVMKQMIEPMKKAFPGLDDAFWNKFFSKVNTDDLTELVVPAYARHFSQDEIDGAIAFYKTPVGRKILAEMPEVVRESMAIGQEWGRKLGELAAQEVSAAKNPDHTL